MTNFKCEECGELFELETSCVVHHLETKHETYELLGSDTKINIKSG